MEYKQETVLAVEKRFPFHFRRKDISFDYFRNSQYKILKLSHAIRSGKTMLLCMWQWNSAGS
jgi:hypothetical protein